MGDFGIAKTVEKTMGGTKIGTYKYMAPEVYHYQPYGHNVDIYSLGLVLYWLLNERRMPFMPLPPEKLKAGIEEQARNRRLSGETLPEPAHGSKELQRIVLKACAYDPKERYQTATEMLRDIENAFGMPVKIEPPKPVPPAPETKPEPPAPPVPPQTERKEKRQLLSGWACSCGRHNPAYVSTCYCGINKYDMSRTPKPNRKALRKEHKDGKYVPGRTYYNGDKVLFEGEKYICIAPAGVRCEWNPSQRPNHWQLVVKQETEDWRKSEAAHRAWLKSMEEKGFRTPGDDLK